MSSLLRCEYLSSSSGSRLQTMGNLQRSLGEEPQPLTLSERNPSQQEVDREGKGEWDKNEFKPERSWKETWPAPF